MIVVAEREALILIEQEAHAHLTGDLAALTAPGEGNQAAFVAAARVHDNGWREDDRQPTVDADGRPHTFTTVDDRRYETVWRRGIARATAVDELVGLLTGLHGARFFAARSSTGMRRLTVAERARQDAVLARLGYGGSWRQLPAAVAQMSDRIALFDSLSLLLCGALGEQVSVDVVGEPYRCSRAGGRVTVRPWPFIVGCASLAVAARRIPPRPYPSHGALRAALADAPATALQVEVAAP